MATFVEEHCLSNYKYLFSSDLVKGKVAFITGGGSGIGFTIAEILMRHGCDCVIASRNFERLSAAAQKLELATGRRCLPVKMDNRKPEEIISSVTTALNHFGRIDYLINNAAGNFVSPVTGLSFNAYKTVIEIDAIGTFNASKVVYEKYMQHHGGVIVNISATLPRRGQALQAHSGSAKAAIDALTRHLAVEWGASNVRVVGIAPGPIADTEGMRRLAGTYYITDQIPLLRLGTRADIGHAVLYMVSEAGNYITGDTLTVDGGAWMTMNNNLYEKMERLKTMKTNTTPSKL